MEIKPYHKNAKKHPDKQLKQIAASLKEFGWQQSIVVDNEGTIIVGHGRWEAYNKYPDGIAKPIPQVAKDLTPTQVKAYRLADNKLNESDWNMELAIEELKELDNLGFDIELTGFDKDLLIEPDAQDDVIPENVPPKAKLGDLYQLGEHRVLCGDSTKSEDVERLMDGKKADMVFTDPPYGIALSGKKNYASRKRNTKSEDYEKIIGDEVEFDMTKVFENIDSKKWWVWGADYLYRTRAINQSSESLGAHPTQKPTELGVRAIMRNTDEKGIVVDVFLGSGSTLIASEKTGRICYGMELDPKYVDVIIKRWEDYTGKAAILL